MERTIVNNRVEIKTLNEELEQIRSVLKEFKKEGDEDSTLPEIVKRVVKDLQKANQVVPLKELGKIEKLIEPYREEGDKSTVYLWISRLLREAEEQKATNKEPQINPIEALKKDIKEAAKSLSNREARYLVDIYYAIQDYRIQLGNQICSLAKTGEPIRVLEYMLDQTLTLEKQIAKVLDIFSNAQPIGRWARSICGIGPVIAAGLIAHIKPENTITAGKTWRYAGLDPTVTWEKGQLRPWNASLKLLCFKLGESFVKVSNNEKDVYGKIYRARKEYEIPKNEAGEYAAQAKAKLEKFKIGKTTEAYKAYSEGRLPKNHINARAKRYAVKLFLSHFCQVLYEMTTGECQPKPYVISILGHADFIAPPNWESPKANQNKIA